MAKPRKRIILGVVAGALVTAGIAGPALSYAADPTPAPSGSASSSAAPNPNGGRHGADDQEFAAALAKELGVDQQKVTDALTKVRAQLHPNGKDGKGGPDRKAPEQNSADAQARLKARLDLAVKDGKITQAEADAILKAAQAGVLGGGPHGGGRPAPAASPSK